MTAPLPSPRRRRHGRRLRSRRTAGVHACRSSGSLDPLPVAPPPELVSRPDEREAPGGEDLSAGGRTAECLGVRVSAATMIGTWSNGTSQRFSPVLRPTATSVWHGGGLHGSPLTPASSSLRPVEGDMRRLGARGNGRQGRLSLRRRSHSMSARRRAGRRVPDRPSRRDRRPKHRGRRGPPRPCLPGSAPPASSSARLPVPPRSINRSAPPSRHAKTGPPPVDKRTPMLPSAGAVPAYPHGRNWLICVDHRSLGILRCSQSHYARPSGVARRYRHVTLCRGLRPPHDGTTLNTSHTDTGYRPVRRSRKHAGVKVGIPWNGTWPTGRGPLPSGKPLLPCCSASSRTVSRTPGASAYAPMGDDLRTDTKACGRRRVP